MHIPACPGELDEETLHSIIESQLKQSIPADSVVEQHAREYLEQYPVVYIVHAEDVKQRKDSSETRYIVYVGETNDIVSQRGSISSAMQRMKFLHMRLRKSEK